MPGELVISKGFRQIECFEQLALFHDNGFFASTFNKVEAIFTPGNFVQGEGFIRQHMMFLDGLTLTTALGGAILEVVHQDGAITLVVQCVTAGAVIDLAIKAGIGRAYKKNRAVAGHHIDSG